MDYRQMAHNAMQRARGMAQQATASVQGASKLTADEAATRYAVELKGNPVAMMRFAARFGKGDSVIKDAYTHEQAMEKQVATMRAQAGMTPKTIEGGKDDASV